MYSKHAPIDPAKQPWPKQAIEAASHGAFAFCQIYYEAYDEPSRRSKVRSNTTSLYFGHFVEGGEREDLQLMMSDRKSQ